MNAPTLSPDLPPREKAEVKHDYPACAVFRGGKCTCDEADNLCPKCGSEEWDEVYEPGRVTPSYRRCAYSSCDHEWRPNDAN